MVQTATVLLEEINGIYVYTESDKILVLLLPNGNLFDRSLEKVISISASILVLLLLRLFKLSLMKESRIWLSVNQAQIIDYVHGRQAEARRCALDGWCYCYAN